MLTVSGSVGAYYLWSFKLGLNENAGLLVSTLIAVLLSAFFYRISNR
jgi:hypothetical protein